MRRNGFLPYEWISDSTGIRVEPPGWENLTKYLEDTREGYVRDYWKDQPVHGEIFSEKDALSGVLAPIT